MRLIINIFAIKSLFMLLAACSVAPVMPPITNPPQQIPMPPIVMEDRPVIAFVLGSGAARGFAHVGVLNVLEENGIEADLVVGTSAGSVVGALYAGGIRGQALVEAAHQLDTDYLIDWVFPNRGVVSGNHLQLYINDLLEKRPIEALQTIFVAVCTRLSSGELVAFNHGDTGMAVRASSTIPGLVQPFEIGGEEYVDGSLVSQLPVRVARQMGAEVVIAVDVSRNSMTGKELQSTFAVMRQAYVIMSHKIAEAERAEADILIRPDVGEIAIGEFELREQAVSAGEAAARMMLPAIREAIADRTRDKRKTE